MTWMASTHRCKSGGQGILIQNMVQLMMHLRNIMRLRTHNGSPNLLKLQRNIIAAIDSERMAQLTCTLGGIKSEDTLGLRSAFVNLNPAKVQAVLECCKREDWNDVILTRTNVDTCLLGLHLCKKVNDVSFFTAHQIVLAAQQFGFSECHSSHTIKASDMTVLDINSPANLSNRGAILHSLRSQTQKPLLHEYISSHTNTPISVIVVTLDESEMIPFYKQGPVTPLATRKRLSKSTVTLGEEEAKPQKPILWLGAMAYIKDMPVVLDKRTRKLYILTVPAILELSQFFGHAMQLSSVLGRLSLKQQTVYQKNGVFPVSVSNPNIFGNIEAPYHVYADRLFSFMVEMHQVVQVSQFPRECRNLLLSLQLYLCQLLDMVQQCKSPQELTEHPNLKLFYQQVEKHTNMKKGCMFIELEALLPKYIDAHQLGLLQQWLKSVVKRIIILFNTVSAR